ncbi:UDP-N-acetylmuramoyl-L-alanine--D-glutamate ligase, partial [bacterium]
MRFTGKKAAVLGLGRSGLAAARGFREWGGEAVVFDRSSRDAVAKPEIADRARSEGIDVVYGFDSVLPEGFDQLIVNPAVDRRHPLLADAVARGIEVIGEIEFAFRIAR